MAGTEWLRNRVIYQVFMPSFADGNGASLAFFTSALEEASSTPHAASPSLIWLSLSSPNVD